MFVYSAEEPEIWLNGYPLVKTIVLTLYLPKLGFLQSFVQMLLMTKFTDFVLYSVHWQIIPPTIQYEFLKYRSNVSLHDIEK